MRISSVRCYLAGARNRSGYHAGSALIRVETDEELVGHGEALLGLFCGEAAVAITRYYEPLLIGADPQDLDGLWQRMFDASVWWGRAGAATSVLGAIEIALWDIAGKRANRPCYQLLSDGDRRNVPVYASLGAVPATPERIPELVHQLQAEQFRGLKLGLQFGDAAGIEFFSPRGSELLRLLEATLSAIRTAAGDDFVIGVDGHMGGIPDPMPRDEALAVANVLGEFGVNFFEEPLSYLDPAGYAWLRDRSPVRIAGGESLALQAGFQAFVDIGALDILQPDMNYVGGLGQGLAIARLATEHGLSMIPHAWCAGPGFMANVHLALACGVVERLEMARELTDFQEASLIEKPVIRDGVLLAPTAPGLGIDFAPGLIEHFPFPAGLAERGSGLVTLPDQA